MQQPAPMTISVRTAIMPPAMAPAASVKFHMLALVAIGAGAFNAANTGAVAWVQFHSHAVIPVWGLGGIMFNSLPSSIIPAVLMSILGSLAARRHLPALSWPAPPPHSWVRRLPASLIARAFVLTTCTTLFVAATTYLVITWSNMESLSFFTTMVMQLIQAFVMGLILGPIIILRVLCEPGFA